MKVKICGLSTIEAVDAAVQNGADALGFVFAPSKRQVTAERARELTAFVPKHVWRVGVFVNESQETIEQIARIAGLTHIQLHGDEQLEQYRKFTLPLICACRMEGETERLKYRAWPGSIPLFDSPRGTYYGGSGHTFLWSELDGVKPNEGLWCLAGGLTVENVREAIALTCAPMVDVSSGVETNGAKDVQKIKAFIRQAKGGVQK
ncbi:MAG: phosphoribosylanthranilate isomerase [Bacilli bacterium]